MKEIIGYILNISPAASIKQLDMKEIIGYILNISPLPRRAIQNFNGA